VTPAAAPRPKSTLYLQVLAGIFLGVLVGRFAPAWGASLRPLGDGFIKLIKMLVPPLVFCTVVGGIAGAGDLKRVGRVGLKALLYFEVLTTVALFLGVGVMHVVAPGRGMNVDVAKLDPASVARFQKPPAGAADVLLDLIPSSVVGAFASGEILPVLVFSVLFGVALGKMGERGEPLRDFIDRLCAALFTIVGMIMRLAPLGAFGAMAFTVGTYGLGTLASLGELMAAFYTTVVLFVVLVLGSIVRALGLSPLRLFLYLKDELLLVLGTSSSESALPRLLARLEELGCDRAIVGLVVPTGYSFNLDGTCIYLTMAALFLGQATNTRLTLGDELSILAILLVSSKGAAAVTGGGFITLAATLGSTGKIPVAAIALLLGVDRFMSEARALTNLLGNAVATLVVSRWESQLDLEKARAALSTRQGGRRALRSSTVGSNT
jgi:aerobic C4-dicarboxylate transport protein